MLAILKLPSKVTPFPDTQLSHSCAVLTVRIFHTAQYAAVGAPRPGVPGPYDVFGFSTSTFATILTPSPAIMQATGQLRYANCGQPYVSFWFRRQPPCKVSGQRQLGQHAQPPFPP